MHISGLCLFLFRAALETTRVHANIERNLALQCEGLAGRNRVSDLDIQQSRREQKIFAQRKRRYENTMNPRRAELLQMVKEAKNEAAEIKRRALEEAESIRSSARVNAEGSDVPHGEEMETGRTDTEGMVWKKHRRFLDLLSPSQLRLEPKQRSSSLMHEQRRRRFCHQLG
ncbi:hypothetical protein R1sor_021509 [Riccia sorocarpa]|uniref:Uncharacterized protein n=1 Tax=Riccia sorocarpa TaxID=122646 RepID=A0ABD3GHA0_9MARC